MKWKGSPIKTVRALGLCVHWRWITLRRIHIWKSCKEKSVRLFTVSTLDQCRGMRGGGGGGLYCCHLLYRDLPLNINTPCILTKQRPIKQRNHNWPWVQGAGWWKHCKAWCDSQRATCQAVTPPTHTHTVMWDLKYICTDLHGHLWQVFLYITVLGLKCSTVTLLSRPRLCELDKKDMTGRNKQ